MKKTIAIILSIMLVLAITLPTAAISVVNVKEIKLDKSTVTMKVGQTYSLKVTLTPANTTQRLLKYVTNNINVAQVTKNGKIVAVGAGATTITVYNVSNNKIFAKCNVIIKTKNEKNYKLTATSPYFLQTGVNYMDKLSKKILEDFNMTLEPIPVSLTDFDNKNRVWISSGDMPDILFSSMIYPDYKNYVEQGLIRALPENYEAQYPNLTKAIDATGIDNFLKSRFGGKLYCSPKPIFMTSFVKTITNHVSLYYRKDWAQNAGLPVKDMYSIEEVTKMAKTFMSKDPNGNGSGKTIGLAIEPGNMMMFFIRPFNSTWNSFYKKDGKYVWGPSQPETLEGLKSASNYYNDGTGAIYKDFYTIKARGEVEAMFNAGLTGMMYNGGAFGNAKRLFDAFGKTNTGKKAIDCIGMANIKGLNGKLQGTELMNLQSVSYFNPHMENEKFQRIMELFDYVATPEVQDYINLGFEGTDYKMSDDKIEITRPKGSDGNFVPISNLYPSYYLWGMLVIAWDNYTTKDPSTDKKLLDMNKKLWADRAELGDIGRVDHGLVFFTAPNYNKMLSITSNVYNDFTAIVLKNDVVNDWNKYVKQNERLVSDALNELNSQLVK